MPPSGTVVAGSSGCADAYTMNDAPCGSCRTANRPPSPTSVGTFNTLPPSDSACRDVSSTFSHETYDIHDGRAPDFFASSGTAINPPIGPALPANVMYDLFTVEGAVLRPATFA